MMVKEYIEREAVVMGVLGLTIVDPMVAQYADAVFHQIQRAPAADVVEVVHGRWITDSLLTTCSECQRSFNILPMFAHYCPNCGARMDGDTNGRL